MLDSIIRFLHEIAGEKFYDIGLVIILVVFLVSFLILEIWLSFRYSKRIDTLSGRLKGKIIRSKTDFEKLSELIDSASIKDTADYWFRNISASPIGNFEIAWKKTDCSLLARSAVIDYSVRKLSRLVPGIIVLFSIITGSMGSIIRIVSADNSQIDVVWHESWQKVVLLLLLGVILASAYWIIDYFITESAIRKTRKLFDISSEILPTFCDDDWRSTQLQEIADMNRKISFIEKSIIDALISAGNDHLFPGLVSSYQKSLEQYLLPEITELRKTTESYSERILQHQQTGMAELADSFYKNLNANYDTQLERQSSVIEQLEHMQQIGAERLGLIMTRSDANLSMQRELNENALQIIEGITASQKSLAEAAERLTSGMRSAGELADGMQALLQADRELLCELASDREKMQSINNNYFEKMNAQVLQLQDDLNSEITNLLSRFTDIYSVTFENIEEKTTGLVENYDSQTRMLIDSLDEQVRNLTFMTKDITTEIAELNRNFRESASEFNSGVEKSLNGHLLSLDTSVNDLIAKLASTTELIRESVDDLPAAVLLARMSIENSSDVASEDK